MKQFCSIILIMGMCTLVNILSAQSKVKHVVVIGIDGFSTLGLKMSNTPTMDSLIRNGSWAPKAHTVLPSSSSPNWASMILGAGPEQHGVTDNDWELEDHSLDPVVEGVNGRFPSIFDILHKQFPAYKLGCIYEWEGFGRLYDKSAVNYDRNGKDAYETMELASSYIKKQKPQLTFIHFDLVDHAGHTYGHGTPRYFATVHIVDSLIGHICQAIRDAGMVESTMIMVVSDHGGIGMGHGGNSPEEVYVPMILSGVGIKKNYKILQQAYNYDVAPTIAYAFHAVPPYVWTGRPLKAAFNENQEPSNLWLGIEKPSAPIFYPVANLNDVSGGLYVDSAAVVSISANKGDVIHYTTDGSEPKPSSRIFRQPFSTDTSCVVRAISINGKGIQSKEGTGFYRVVHKNSNSGISVKYYKGDDWKHVPNFEMLTPVLQDTVLECRLGMNKGQEEFIREHSVVGAVFDGYITIVNSGEYNFYTHSDDGSLLYVDGKLIVDNDGNHGVIERTGRISLGAGKHHLKVEYINNDGGYWLDILYKGPGVIKQIVPGDKLSLN